MFQPLPPGKAVCLTIPWVYTCVCVCVGARVCVVLRRKPRVKDFRFDFTESGERAETGSASVSRLHIFRRRIALLDFKKKKCLHWDFLCVSKFPELKRWINYSCVIFQAAENFLLNEEPSRGPGMPECFVVSDSYRVCILFLFFSLLLLLLFHLMVLNVLFESLVIMVTDRLFSCFW